MPATPDPIAQAAAIPVRDRQFCLVTSSSGKRWGIPKGIIDPGQTSAECARQEAWEEAGLVGILDAEPVGSYAYKKWGRTLHVTVYLMRVTEVHDDWPERSVRQRIWVSPDEAMRRIAEPGLQEVLRAAVRASEP